MAAKAGRYVAGAATGLVIALFLTACEDAGQDAASSSGKPTSSGAQLSAAQTLMAKAAEQASGVRTYQGTISMAVGVPGDRTLIAGTLAYQIEPLVMRYTVPTIEANGHSNSGYTELIVGDKMYTKGPMVRAKTGKPWVGETLSHASKSTGLDMRSMQEGAQGHPGPNTRLLTASTDVHQVGQEMVVGVRTTHSQGTFRLKEGVAKLGGAQRTQFNKSFGGELGVDVMTFDVWIDSRQMPRKVTIATPPGSKLEVKQTTTYTAFNGPITVTAPPKSQVADGSGLPGGARPNVPS
jgi:hypothetical protein